MRVITVIEGRGMAVERCAAQPFEHANLDFVRIKCRQPVEAVSEAGQILAR